MRRVSFRGMVSRLVGAAGIIGGVSLVAFTVSGPGAAVVKAEKPPQYFVDKTKLPFDALSGTTTTRLWGVHGGAGYRVEVLAQLATGTPRHSGGEP